MNYLIFVFFGVIFLFSCLIFPTFLWVKFFSKKVSLKFYIFSFLSILSFYLLFISSFFYIFYIFENNLEQKFFYYNFFSIFLFLIFWYKTFEILKISFKKFLFFKIFVIFISFINFLAFFMISKEFFTVFQVSWNSMNSSYFDKEIVLVNKFDRKFKNWEVVVFENSWKYFLKRIIAKSKDKILIKNWKVFIQKDWNSKFLELKENYLNKQNIWKTYGLEEKNLIVPEKSYFLLWDNRIDSTDSRNCFGNCDINSKFILEEKIIWKVFLDLWYFDFWNFRINFN